VGRRNFEGVDVDVDALFVDDVDVVVVVDVVDVVVDVVDVVVSESWRRNPRADVSHAVGK